MSENYKRQFLENFFASPDWKQEAKTFDHLLGGPIWWRLDGKIEKSRLKPSRKVSDCDLLRHGRYRTTNCYRNLLRGLKRTGLTRHAESFSCHRKLRGLVCPIMKNEEVMGFVGICHIRPEVPDLKAIEAIFTALISSAAHTTEKEMELQDLYKTVRPRAIALSTTHTVHRIMSSTLNMDELLPRIARLTLQALRARRCSIMLVDETGKFLLPKAGIGLSQRGVGRYKLPLGKAIPGRVAKSGSFYVGRGVLCAPLIEEDVIGVITVWEKEAGKTFEPTDQEILSILAEQAVIAIRNAQLYEEQQKLTMGSIKSLAAVLDMKAPHKYTPSPAFINITLALAKELAPSEEELTSLRYAALLHDAGKISVSENILKKPSALTDREYEAIKKHPYRGAKIIKPIDVLKPIVPIILYHHERYDGSGYPKGLKSDQIPLGARIMAVADAFWAMTTERPYRKRISTQQAVAEIKKHSGTQFDPKVVEAFLKVVRRPEIRQILRSRPR